MSGTLASVTSASRTGGHSSVGHLSTAASHYGGLDTASSHHNGRRLNEKNNVPTVFHTWKGDTYHLVKIPAADSSNDYIKKARYHKWRKMGVR